MTISEARPAALVVVLVTGCVVAVATPLRAQSPQQPAPAASSSAPGPLDPKRDEARALLRKGKALHDAGEIEKALDFFLRSKAAFPAAANTLDVALCLRELGRFDEALEQYEEAVASFGAAFDENDRAHVPATMAELREKLGAVRVSANTTGSLVIAGRDRGLLPRATAVRMLPGTHTLRVMKDGYKTYETRIVVRVGETVVVDAQLEPLAASGGLRIEDATLEGADVLVDGIRVGKAPWEGTLAPGPHVVLTRLANDGSAPTLATVLQGQTALVRLASSRLSGNRRIRVQPATASLRIARVSGGATDAGEVPLGKAEWVGALPAGDYRVTASEEGYTPHVRALSAVAGDEGETVELSLRVDEAHPRWPRKPTGKLSAELLAMFGIGGTFDGGAAESCAAPRCASRGLVSGPIAGVSASFELPVRLSFELAGGGLSLSQSLRREVPRAGPGTATTTYRLDDHVRFKGWWLGAGAGYRIPLGGRWSLRSRMLAGVIFARSSDTITGAVVTPSGEAPAFVDGSGSQVAGTPLFLFPQLGVTASVGDWTLGGSLGAWIVASSGPSLAHGDVRVTPSCGAASPSAPGCVADSSQLQREQAYGVFAVLVPQASVARAF